MSLASVVGFIIGFLFGISSITTLLGFMGNVLIQIDEMLRNFSTMSTIVLLIIGVILVIKIRAIASLVAGAVVGAILNLILAQNGINVMGILRSYLGF